MYLVLDQKTSKPVMQYIGFASTKGGVAKTTSAIHFAYWAALQGRAVVLVDDDANRTAIKWLARAQENPKFEPPFTVATFAKMARAVAGKDLVVLDTQASIGDDDLKDLAEDCDLIVIPAKPDIDSAAAAVETAEKLQGYGGTYRILLTDCPTGSSKSGADLAADLVGDGYQVLKQRIRRGEGVRHASLAGATVAQQPSKYRGPWWDYQAVFTEIFESLRN